MNPLDSVTLKQAATAAALNSGGAAAPRRQARYGRFLTSTQAGER